MLHTQETMQSPGPSQSSSVDRAAEEMLTPEELTRVLKLKRKQSVYELVAKGMPCMRLGRNMRFKLSKVMAWMERSK